VFLVEGWSAPLDKHDGESATESATERPLRDVQDESVVTGGSEHL